MSEIKGKADFSILRYAQCWEDSDILLEALNIQPGQTCLSIASAGDNTLSLLCNGPQCVIALDLSPSQLACLELRVAAYRKLQYEELLELVGSKPSRRRIAIYDVCKLDLSHPAREFWDRRLQAIEKGIGNIGKFEHYLSTFRRFILPLFLSRSDREQLLNLKTLSGRELFYQTRFENWRWRFLFKIFFSRFIMSRLGRDPSFFNYVEGSVADKLLDRVRYGLTVLNPADNPYLQWIFFGYHPQKLPHSLRPENFDLIRQNIDRLEWHCQSLEDFLASAERKSIDAFNLSDIFEYMSLENYHSLLEKIAAVGRPGGRLAYWNMLAPRSRPNSLAEKLQPLSELAHELFHQDKAFFYSSFIVEEIL